MTRCDSHLKASLLLLCGLSATGRPVRASSWEAFSVTSGTKGGVLEEEGAMEGGQADGLICYVSRGPDRDY